jgi:hypothetical protein
MSNGYNLAAIFFVIYSELHHGDNFLYLHKNDLQFGLVQHIYGAKYLLNSVHIPLIGIMLCYLNTSMNENHLQIAVFLQLTVTI